MANMSIEERVAKLEAIAEANKEALQLARKQLDDWKRSANEWRAENMDQRRLFITKEKADAMVLAVIGTIIATGTAILLAVLFA
jgi:tetrahydromethanopterin S-methyltransferase subunit B